MYDSLQTEQRQRWQQGDHVRIQFFLEKYPGLRSDADGLSQLVCHEIALRDSYRDAPSIEEYLQAFPECTSSIRRQFELVQPIPLETIAAPDPTPSNRESPASTRDPVENFETVQRESQGDTLRDHATHFSVFPNVPGFEILNELGRGGMGIVYRARQLSANRMVALKVVRNELLDTLPSATRASTLERFRTEAQAAAQLQHDNLVSVYEIGEAPPTSPGGSPLRYYAMRFVQGSSLFDIIRDGPLENHRAAAYIEPVARALQAAHEQGILHRDLKPHNIMVDRSADRPLVTDFGLAKFIEGSDALTYAGEIMGTPSYMSPEQATDAGKVTASADLYSIGATLYHLLTGRAPFQASNVAETIRQIIQKDPVAPRQLNASIDRDLETICLKCLQKDPARRYASCTALAEDLHLYLTGCPIIARPVGRAERLWRWCRRNPIPASLTGTAAVLAIATFLSIIIGYRNTTAALAASESNLQRALSVVGELFTRVSEDELLNEPGMQQLRKDLLEKALKHYQYFLTENAGRESLKDEVAASHFRVGIISQTLGQMDRAQAELTKAMEIQSKLLDRQPNDPQRLKAMADTFNALGKIFNAKRDYQVSTSMFDQSVKARMQLTNSDPENFEYQRLLANSTMNLGLALVENGDLEKGLSEMTKAQIARQKLLLAQPENDHTRRELAMGWYSLGETYIVIDNFEAALPNLQSAIGEFQALLHRDSRSMNNRYLLGVSFRLLGGVLDENGKTEEALQAFEDATTKIQSLATENPDVTAYHSELAVLAMNRGEAYTASGDPARAAQAWRNGLSITRNLISKSPSNPDLQLDLAACLSALGEIEQSIGKSSIARQMHLEAKEVLKNLEDLDHKKEWYKILCDRNSQALEILTNPIEAKPQ